MLGRKKKREIQTEEEEENGLHKSKSLLEYQNKSLCTLINDLKNKLKSKEESLSSLESKFNSMISFFNIFSSTINSINSDIASALSKNKLSINESIIPTDKIKIYSSPSEFLHNLLGNEKEEKSDNRPDSANNQQVQSQPPLISNATNNKIIVDDEEEDEEMKEEKKEEINNKEAEFGPIINLVKNMEVLINKLLPIIKLNDEQYEKIFANVDEEIASKNKELEDMTNDLNKSLNNYKLEIEMLKTQNEINQAKLNEYKEKNESLTTENFRLNRKINTHPLMPLLILEDQCQNKEVKEHNCICIVCGKTFTGENQSDNNKE